LAKGEKVWLPSLRRGQNDWGQMLESLAQLYVLGAQVNWDGFDQDYPRRKINLPTYPFQRERYWIETASQKSEVAAELYRKAASTRSSHPLLGQRLVSALKPIQYETRLSSKTLPFARDHRFYGMAVLPATAFLEMAMGARAEASATRSHALEEVAFIEALTLGEDDARTAQVIMSSDESGTTAFEIFSLNDGDDEEGESWRLHATGKISPVGKGSAAPASASLQGIRARCRDELPVGDFYRHLGELGVEYGPSMQGIERLWRGNREALGRLRLPAALASEADIYQFHPVLLDSCLQLIGAILMRDLGVNSGHDVYMPFALERLQVYERPNTHLWGHAFIRDGYGPEAEVVVGDLFLFDDAGGTVAELSGLRFKKASRDALLRVTQASLRDWTYEVEWQPKPLGEADHPGEQSPSPRQPGTWLIFADGGGVGSRLEKRLEQHGGTCVMVYAGESYAVLGETRYQIDPLKVEDFQRMLREGQVRWGRGLLGIVHLWSLDLELPQKAAISGLLRSQELSCGSVLYLVQALARAEALASARLWLVTRGAQAVSPGPVPTALAQTPLLGLGTAIDLEHPDLRCTRIDLDPIDENPTGDQELFDEIWSKDSENQVAFRSHRRYVPRLVPSGARVRRSQDGASIVGKQPFELRIPSAATLDHPVETFRSDSTYLITGGLGGLGLLVARWMMERGVRHLALMSRGEATGAANETVNQLRQAGAQVLVVQADVSQREQVAGALAEMGRSMPPLRGIVHCAGVIDDGMLLQQNWKRFGRVLAPKVEGAWNLHCLTLDTPLDFFVLFSSAASLLGSTGQANYGAANAFLDALAHRRHAEGLAALSINWGPWARVGMTANLGDRENERWADQGLVMIEPDQGIQVLEKVMQRDVPQVAVLPIHWPKLLKQFPRGGEPPLLAEIAQRTLSSVEADRSSGETGDLSRKLANADPEDRHELLFDHICSEVIKVLRLGPSFELKPDQGLTELGMDSLMAVELANRLKRSLGRSLPPTLAFERPTIEALCSYLSDQVLGVAGVQFPSGDPDRGIAAQANQMEELASLSEEELEKTLTAELEREGY
jgi:acyl transferase domain-containing protein/acyl carrier protein